MFLFDLYVLFSVLYDTLENGDISVKTYKKKFDLETASIIADLDKPVDITVKELLENGYLYITTPTKLEFIRLIGLFEDPIIAKQFETYCEEQCTDCGDCIDYQQEEFPIDNDMIDALIELTIQELIILFSQAKQDINNNSAENTSNG